MIYDDSWQKGLKRNPDWGPRKRGDAPTEHNSRQQWILEEPFTFDPTRYQRRLDFEPGHAFMGDYGRNAMGMRFLLAGDKGVASFLLYTGWYPDTTRVGQYGVEVMHQEPAGHDLSYHALVPQYDDQDSQKCEYTSTGRCYCDGTSLGGSALGMQFLMTGDADVIWQALVHRHDALRAPATLEAGTVMALGGDL